MWKVSLHPVEERGILCSSEDGEEEKAGKASADGPPD